MKISMAHHACIQIEIFFFLSHQSSQGIPQLDGTHDHIASCSTNTQTDRPCCSGITTLKEDQTQGFEIEIDLSNIDKRKLRRKCRKRQKDALPQFDGNQDTSSSEEDNFDDDEDDDDDEKEDADDAGGEDEVKWGFVLKS